MSVRNKSSLSGAVNTLDLLMVEAKSMLPANERTGLETNETELAGYPVAVEDDKL